MRGSGYVEIIEEARLVANGCIKNVKEFAKVLFNLKAVNEALEHLLLEVFCEEENVGIHPTCLLTLIGSYNGSNLDSALTDQSTTELIQGYLEFYNPVRNGYLGKASKSWLSFMDQVKLILMLTYAVKTHNRKFYFIIVTGKWLYCSLLMMDTTSLGT